MKFRSQELDLSMPDGRDVKGVACGSRPGLRGERSPPTGNAFLNLGGTDWGLSGIRLSVRPSVNISFYHNSSNTTGCIFLNLVRMFLSISSCANTEKFQSVDKNVRRRPSLKFTCYRTSSEQTYMNV